MERQERLAKRYLLVALLLLLGIALLGCNHCNEGEVEMCLHDNQGSSCDALRAQVTCYQHCCDNEIISGGATRQVKDLTKNLVALINEKHGKHHCSANDPCVGA
eukprot:TRINITY_DN94673_c0_g1_i1.p3 TRINITY_DN94673_c0_g1~~TRINITY_DN94673_c0_g1_i1.p3  ORF type:complete len:104 (-),score=17.00 TRINITY_DN94673_c0_g1_i1:253-564(-)